MPPPLLILHPPLASSWGLSPNSSMDGPGFIKTCVWAFCRLAGALGGSDTNPGDEVLPGELGPEGSGRPAAVAKPAPGWTPPHLTPTETKVGIVILAGIACWELCGAVVVAAA